MSGLVVYIMSIILYIIYEYGMNNKSETTKQAKLSDFW